MRDEPGLAWQGEDNYTSMFFWVARNVKTPTFSTFPQSGDGEGDSYTSQPRERKDLLMNGRNAGVIVDTLTPGHLSGWPARMAPQEASI